MTSENLFPEKSKEVISIANSLKLNAKTLASLIDERIVSEDEYLVITDAVKNLQAAMDLIENKRLYKIFLYSKPQSHDFLEKRDIALFDELNQSKVSEIIATNFVEKYINIITPAKIEQLTFIVGMFRRRNKDFLGKIRTLKAAIIMNY